MYGNESINRTIWIDNILKRTIDVLSTHTIRFNLMKVSNDIGKGRARHRFQVFPAMVLGMAVLGLITIPIGFHLMSIIGGKALFMGTMALLISTMTSLKRVSKYHIYHLTLKLIIAFQLADNGSPIGSSTRIL